MSSLPPVHVGPWVGRGGSVSPYGMEAPSSNPPEEGMLVIPNVRPLGQGH